MARLELEGVVKTFGAVRAVDGVEVSVPHGEFLAILGPSGCGKTTLLRLLAGLETIESGRILADGVPVSAPGHHVPPERRNVGVVFQSYALWPHMTVSENAGYPLRVTKCPAGEREARTADALAAVELSALADRRPHQLSGGQQQRVALARCLTARPGLILMDEPLANLDMHLRERMLAEFRAFHARADATTVYITHDQSEAMSLADRIAVMVDGRFAQVAAPEVLYRSPATEDVARFIGVSTLIEGQVLHSNGRGPCLVAALGVDIEAETSGDLGIGQGAVLVVRPEAVTIGAEGFPARVVRAAYLGGRFLIEAEASDGTLVKGYADKRALPGEAVRLAVRTAWALPRSGGDQRSSLQGNTPAGKRLEMA